MGIPILQEIPSTNDRSKVEETKYDVIVDAIFGFSFHGTAPREPYATAISQMVQLQKEQSVLLSVDVPSGWDVDGGDLTGTNFHPDVLISLTAPKLSAKKFEGRHFVGGRFLPPSIAEKYGIQVSESETVGDPLLVARGDSTIIVFVVYKDASLSWSIASDLL